MLTWCYQSRFYLSSYEPSWTSVDPTLVIPVGFAGAGILGFVLAILRVLNSDDRWRGLFSELRTELVECREESVTVKVENATLRSENMALISEIKGLRDELHSRWWERFGNGHDQRAPGTGTHK